ncbi:hypothetical protein VP01_312g10 [Puccinia sorghi]|uniref:Uncharacterized protein n=1 Tax=Puccinia sorghi TaxID=27349 RepID=A0A0L6UZ32_9BASI|nr:hypothetical protein VP01_312g10 [Puccinia sorghi]
MSTQHQSDSLPSSLENRADNLLSYHELRLGKEIEKEHQLGLSNSIPIILVILPNLAAMFFDGEPESWRHSLIFLLVVFFLYKISKAPWQLYASARTTRILSQARVHSSTATQQQSSKYCKTIYPIRSDQFLTELNRNEMAFLLLATFSPAIGVAFLIFLQSKLDLGLEYLNSHSTLLYLLASLVKPLGHLHDRLLQRSQYLQSQLQFPVRLADQFNETIDHLSLSLGQLQGSSLSKAELDTFRRTHIEAPIAELSRRLTKYQTNDELHQLRAASRLSSLEETLGQLVGQLQKAEETLDKLVQLDQAHQATTTPIHSLGKIVHQLLDPSTLSVRDSPSTASVHPAAEVSRQQEWLLSHPESPRYLKRHLKVGTPPVEEQRSWSHYLRLLNPFPKRYHATPAANKLSSSPNDRPKSRNVILRLMAWPIVMTILAPLSFVLSTINRIVGISMRLFRWSFVVGEKNKTRGWREAATAIHDVGSPRARGARPRSPPSSGSAGTTSPDSISSDLSLLLDHPQPPPTPPSSTLGHKPKDEAPPAPPWNPSPEFYHPIHHHPDHHHRVAYQNQDHHLF